MEVKSQKCPACGTFYNSIAYEHCPFCKEVEDESKGKKKKKFFKDIWGWNKEIKQTEQKSEESNPQTDYEEVPPTEGKKDIGEVPPTEGKRDIGEVPPTVEKRDIEEVPPTVRKKLTTGPSVAKDFTVGENSEKESPEPSLKDVVVQSGQTIGKYFSGSGEDEIDPVVGWLVCVKGVYFGKSFELKSGKNRIGRSYEMDIKLLNDQSVSRTCLAIIVFDTKAGDFSVLPGESDSLCYVNGQAVYGRVVLQGNERIELGDSEKNQFLFIPLCGENFKWSEYTLNKKGNNADK